MAAKFLLEKLYFHSFFTLFALLLLWPQVSSCGAAPKVDETFSAPLFKRNDYDDAVLAWKRDHPHLVGSLPDGAIESLWQQISVPRPVKRASSSGDAAFNSTGPRMRAASASQIKEARKLVNGAIAKGGRRNQYLSSNPRRNHYSLKPEQPATRKSREQTHDPYVVSGEVKAASALLAEVDAAALDFFP